MVCPKCNSNNVNVQMVSESKLKKRHRGLAYWLLLGWLIDLCLWIFLTIPRLLIAMFGGKRNKIVTKHKSIAVCQNCGHNWNI